MSHDNHIIDGINKDVGIFGYEKAKEVLPDMWKAIYFERFEDYRKEHLNA